jgi:eukaryotic-like serine/threonine-protein kinase
MGPGTILDGKYQIVQLLGSGGMGDVFKVRHIQLNTVRTIKVLRSSLLADDWYRKRFLREARLATQVHHSNVAIVHDFATLPNGSYYMVSEFIDGLTVRQWLKRYGPFPLGLAVDVVSQVLTGLAHCHRRKLLHRDISPDNIMISVDPEDRPVAKIIDLGIAKDVAGAAADATQTGLFMGNPKYCSPEQLGQLKEGEELDLRTDLYSMGMVLYEMVTGSGPFQSTTPHGFFIKHLTEAPPSLKKAKPDITWPEGFEAVLLKALEKDRARRYGSASEFADALRPFAIDLSRGLEATFGLKLDRLDTQDTDRTDRIAFQEDGTPVRVSELGAQAKDRTEKYVSQRELEQLSKKGAEDRDWASCEADGSDDAWRGFLNRHPDSPRREEVLALLSELQSFQEASRVDTRPVWETFLASWPLSRYRDEALRRVEQSKERETSALEQARSVGSAQAYRGFLKDYATSPLATKAQALLQEQLGFEAALQKDTERSWAEFLDHWPSGANAASAATRKEQAQRREEEAYRNAIQERTAAALRSFLDKYPDAKDRLQAQEHLREATDYEAADADGSEGAWQGFLDRHRESARREEAGRMLSEARSFKEAARVDSREAWETFAKSWPESRHRTEVQKRLEQAKRREVEALERASSKGSAAALREFLEKYAGSPLAGKASALLEEQLGFETAEKKDTEGAWEGFLRRWSSGRNAAAAGKRRDEARRREEEALQGAIREGTSGALRNFLEKYPEGARRPRAQEHLQEALAFEAAGADGKAGWERYLASHPNGAHAEVARTKLRQLETEALLVQIQEHERKRNPGDLERLIQAHPASHPAGAAAREALARLKEAAAAEKREEEEKTWQSCETSGTEEAWQQFIKTYPDSTRIQAARKKLSEAKARAAEKKRAAIPSEPEPTRPAAAGDIEPTVRMRLPDEGALEKTLPLATPAVPPVSKASDAEKTAQISAGFQKPAAAVAPRAAEPAAEKAIPMPARIEKPALEPTLVPLETPFAPKRRGAYVAAAAFVFLAVAAVVWLARHKPEEGKTATKDSGRNVASVSKTDAAASPTVAAPAQMGLLVIDAVPWGQVDRAQDAGGKNWSGGPDVYTPLAVAVPPGQYSVLITNPGFPGKRLSLSAQVRPGERAMCVGRFEPIDAKAYFETQGWKP